MYNGDDFGYSGVSMISPYFNNFDSNHFELILPVFLLETGVIRR